jgi:hypothetical protein
VSRRASDVSRVLKAAGIPVGYRHTDFGYEGPDGRKVTEPGCEVTRKQSHRYDGEVDAGCVRVFIIDPARPDLTPTTHFYAKVVNALLAAHLPLARAAASHIEIKDPE